MQGIPTPTPKIPQPPIFACVEDERCRRKQRLAAAFRLLVSLKLHKNF
ncbi:MAG: hypothetical protein JO235_21300 [Chroococcidiopsidaceae cyanobacterium CP_BM_RX_35]|nr:hypothetical protein [Chroococcidiopsidaceae cyanobacterium CP_BM_RX_35]